MTRSLPQKISRRTLLVGTGGLAVSCAYWPEPLPSPTGVFRHGVASGDPLADRVILWTRVSREGMDTAAVEWELAADAAFSRVLRRASTQTDAERDFTVKLDVDGLDSGRDYYYRFRSGGETSPVGRTRTLPRGPLAHWRIALLACANYPAGFFHAYRAVAADPHVHLVLHLGDYLYEYGLGGYATQAAQRLGRTPDPPHETVTLEDYRRRHAQYKTDPDLQAAHAAAPWVAIWDDHEVANDSWAGGAQNHQPETEGSWQARKQAALRAYYEWMPVREPDGQRPLEQAWKAFEIGDLATLVLLESRLSARSRAIHPRELPLNLHVDRPEDPQVQQRLARFLREVVGDPRREMLGGEQQAFVSDALARSVCAGKPWQVLGNQVTLAHALLPDFLRVLPAYARWFASLLGGEVWNYVRRSAFGLPVSLDSWDGYPAARERLYAAAREARANLLVATGNTHSYYAANLIDEAGERRGVELGVTSVTSPPVVGTSIPGVDFNALAVAANPGTIVHHNPHHRGFAVLDLTPGEAIYTLVGVSAVQQRPFATHVLARFHTTPGQRGGTSGLQG